MTQMLREVSMDVGRIECDGCVVEINTEDISAVDNFKQIILLGVEDHFCFKT
jgi:hypothetical protein